MFSISKAWLCKITKLSQWQTQGTLLTGTPNRAAIQAPAFTTNIFIGNEIALMIAIGKGNMNTR